MILIVPLIVRVRTVVMTTVEEVVENVVQVRNVQNTDIAVHRIVRVKNVGLMDVVGVAESVIILWNTACGVNV